MDHDGLFLRFFSDIATRKAIDIGCNGLPSGLGYGMSQISGQTFYHGIIIKQSQKDKSIFIRMKISGKRRVFGGIITLYKVEVAPNDLESLISSLQSNMATHLFFRKMEFYAHFYREQESSRYSRRGSSA